MSSNLGQNYPYSSESEEDRARLLESVLATHPGLREKVAAESIGLAAEPRWWVWKCPSRGCPGLLHSAGYARDMYAIYVVCDTCAHTYRR